jgi:hypothetical protein
MYAVSTREAIGSAASVASVGKAIRAMSLSSCETLPHEHPLSLRKAHRVRVRAPVRYEIGNSRKVWNRPQEEKPAGETRTVVRRSIRT